VQKGLLTFGLTRRPIVLLILMTFVGGGLIAFFRLNIEAYPNPAPVILEITAQTPGLSAEEMERFFTIPIEVGLAATPGVENIRSTSFYGLSFVRVTFAYGVDYYFALTQAEISLQQNVSLPNNVTPQILGSSLVGEIYRYQLVGPPHFGLSNLRAVQDWIVQCRMLSVPGVHSLRTGWIQARPTSHSSWWATKPQAFAPRSSGRGGRCRRKMSGKRRCFDCVLIDASCRRVLHHLLHRSGRIVDGWRERLDRDVDQQAKGIFRILLECALPPQQN
jgi:hypothetical protein